MVQIKIKGVNKTYHIVASFDDVHEFIIQLEERLKACHGTKDRYFEAFFHVPQMSAQDILDMIRLCESCYTIILGINYTPHEKAPIFIEKELRSGERYEFEQPVILLGNIRKQAFVICSESLYVIGSIHGSVDLLYEDCILCCSSIKGNVRICDSHFQNVTSLAPVKVYYKNRRLEINEYKEERMWERQ